MQIKIIEASGKTVQTQNIVAANSQASRDVDVSRLPKGLYMIEVITDKGISKGKFIKD